MRSIPLTHSTSIRVPDQGLFPIFFVVGRSSGYRNRPLRFYNGLPEAKYPARVAPSRLSPEIRPATGPDHSCTARGVEHESSDSIGSSVAFAAGPRGVGMQQRAGGVGGG